jgi:hypothetical protein
MSVPGERWVRSERVLWRTAPGFLVVADADGEVTRAEGPAADIWELLVQPLTADELSDELASRFGAPVEAVRTDVTRFLLDLRERGIVDRVAAGR